MFCHIGKISRHLLIEVVSEVLSRVFPNAFETRGRVRPIVKNDKSD